MKTASQQFAASYARAVASHFGVPRDGGDGMISMPMSTLESYLELAHVAGTSAEFARLDKKAELHAGGAAC